MSNNSKKLQTLPFHTSYFILHTSAASQRGQSSIYVVILLMIIIFAVMFSGGGASLFTGNVASTVTDAPSPSPEESPSLGISPTSLPSLSPAASSPTIAPATGWSISVTFLGCNVNGYPKADIITAGNENGYISLEISNGSSGFTQVGTADFLYPKSKNTATLVNKNGYNLKPWRVTLFAGGVKVSNEWTGGILQKTYNGSPTNCP